MVHPTIETGANIVGVFLSSASILLPHLTWDSTFFRNWSTPSCVSFDPAHTLSYWSWNNFAHPSTGPRCKTQSSVLVQMWAIFNSASWSSPRTGVQEASCDMSILASIAPESCWGEACEPEPYNLLLFSLSSAYPRRWSDLFRHNLHCRWSLRLLAVIDSSLGSDGVLTHGRDVSDNGEMVEVSRQSPCQGVDWI